MISFTKYFKFPITFGRKSVDNNIQLGTKLNNASYICLIDINVLATTYYDDNYKNIIENSLFNLCDGSFLPF